MTETDKHHAAVPIDPETQASWDLWVTAHIRNQLAEQDLTEPMIESIAEALVHDRRAMRDHVKAELAKPIEEISRLREEVAKLHGEVATTRQKLVEGNDQMRWLRTVSKAVRLLIRPLGIRHASVRAP